MGGAFQALCPLVSRAHKLAEVEAAAHMLHPHDLRHVDGVEGQGPGGLLPGLGVDKAVEGVQPHHAAGVPDAAQLVVGQVPAHIAQGTAVGVGCDHRPGGQVHHVPEAAVVQMGHVHHHPQFSHPAHRPASRLRQPRLKIASGSGGQGIGLVPGEHPQPGALAVVPVHAGGVPADGRHALHRQEGVDLARCPGSLCLRCGVDRADLRTFRQVCPGTGKYLMGAAQIGCRILPGGVLPERLSGTAGPDGQHQPLHAAPPQPVQMVVLQHPPLPQQAPPGHIVQQIRMRVEYHKLPPFCSVPLSLCRKRGFGKPFRSAGGEFFPDFFRFSP